MAMKLPTSLLMNITARSNSNLWPHFTRRKKNLSNIISREIRFDASWCIYVMYVNRNVHTSIIRIRFGSNRSKNSWHHERPCMQPFWHGAFITGLAFKELATWPTPTGSFLNRSTYSYSSSNGNGSNFYWIHLYPFFMKEEAFQRCNHCKFLNVIMGEITFQLS